MRILKADLNAHLSVIEAAMDRSELMPMWQGLYERPLPKTISLKLMKLAIAYRLQEKVFGGRKPAVRRYLQQMGQRGSGMATATAPIDGIPVGTRMIRQWHGRTFEAVVENNGVVVNGEYFQSLSDAARSITGAHWSGPRFFGLRKVASK